MKIVYILIALFVAFLWGLLPVVHKYVLQKHNIITVIVFSALIYALCTLILAWLYWPSIKKDLRIIDKNTILLLTIVTIFAGFLANIIYMYVLEKHDSHIISALVYTSPVFTLILAILFLNEKPTMLSLIGIFLIISGIIMCTLS